MRVFGHEEGWKSGSAQFKSLLRVGASGKSEILVYLPSPSTEGMKEALSNRASSPIWKTKSLFAFCLYKSQFFCLCH